MKYITSLELFKWLQQYIQIPNEGIRSASIHLKYDEVAIIELEVIASTVGNSLPVYTGPHKYRLVKADSLKTKLDEIYETHLERMSKELEQMGSEIIYGEAGSTWRIEI